MTPSLDNVHPMAAFLPLMEGEPFDKLVADIKAHGLLEPVWILPDGRTIDGRNRVRACQVDPPTPITTRVYEGDQDDASILNFVMSMNMHRRHLTPAQQCKLALDIEPIYAEAAKKRQEAGVPTLQPAGGKVEGRNPTSADEAAATVGGEVSGRSVQRAKAVREKGIPELQAAVFADKPAISLTKAEKIAKLPPEEQAKAVREAIKPPAKAESGKPVNVNDPPKDKGKPATPATSAGSSGKHKNRQGYIMPTGKAKLTVPQAVGEAIQDFYVKLEPDYVALTCKQISEGKLTEPELKLLKEHVKGASRKVDSLCEALYPGQARERFVAAFKEADKAVRIEEVRAIMEALGVGVTHLADSELSINLKGANR